MKEGAYDYITKPFQVDEIRLIIEKALEKKLLSKENRRLRNELRLVIEKALEKKLLSEENRRLRTALRSRTRSLVGSSGGHRRRAASCPCRSRRAGGSARASERRAGDARASPRGTGFG